MCYSREKELRLEGQSQREKPAILGRVLCLLEGETELASTSRAKDGAE